MAVDFCTLRIFHFLRLSYNTHMHIIISYSYKHMINNRLNSYLHC
jgi:hypothetical protein